MNELKKPSDLLQLMVDGINFVKKHKQIEWDMSTFASQHGDICCGCAATAVHLHRRGLKKIKDPDEFCYEITSALVDVDSLEETIDKIRLGGVCWAFHYLGFPLNEQYDHRFCLRTYNVTTEWPKYSRLIRKVIKEMRANGH